MKKWDFLSCKNEALKYRTKQEFFTNAGSAYNASKRNGWFNDITKHMFLKTKPKNYWTFNRCQEEALKYNTRYEFQKKNGSAYNAARKNMWINLICMHMIKTQKPTGYWTFNKCQEEALKYSTRYEFQKKSVSAYSAAFKKEWLNLICNHM